MRSIVILTFFLWGCVTIQNPATERTEFYFINEKTEIAIGKNLVSKIISENKIVKSPKLNDYVERIGKKIAFLSDRCNLTYHFYIIDEDGINAFALPGGYIFVNRGTVKNLTKDELAFVLAHEIGHICARHPVKRLQASLGMQLILNIALKNVENISIRRAVDIMYNIITLGYSRQDEFVADSLAVKYTYRAGYDPNAGITLMEKLKKEDKNQFTLVFLESHPPIPERIRNIKEKVAGLLNQSNSS